MKVVVSRPSTCWFDGSAVVVCMPKLVGIRVAGDLDRVGRGCWRRICDVAVGGVHARGAAGQRAERGLQFGQGRYLADAGAERDRQRRIGADRDGHRLPLRHGALRQQIGGIDGADRQAELGHQGRRRAGDVDRGVGRRCSAARDDSCRRSVAASMPGGNAADRGDPVAGREADRRQVALSPASVDRVGERRASDQLAADDRRPRCRRRRRSAPASAALILVATCAAVSVDRIVPTETATPPLRPAAWTVIAAGAPPTVPPPPVKPPVPLTPHRRVDRGEHLRARHVGDEVDGLAVDREGAAIHQRRRHDLRAGQRGSRVRRQRRAEAGDLRGRRRAGDRIGRECLRIDQLRARHVWCHARWSADSSRGWRDIRSASSAGPAGSRSGIAAAAARCRRGCRSSHRPGCPSGSSPRR